MRSRNEKISYSYVISVSLCTGCYRHLQISANATLADLHSAILDAFGFDDDHAHAFFMDNKLWSDADCYYLSGMRSGDRATRNYRLYQLGLHIGSKFKYVFDFGDCWAFSLRVLRILDEDIPEPRIVRSAGDAPEQYPSFDEDDMGDADEDDTDDLDDEELISFPETYPPDRIHALYKALPLPARTVKALQDYFCAFANLYAIIPLRKALEIYNSQNPPIEEAAFLQFAELIRHDLFPFVIMGADEIYSDWEGAVSPMDRLLIDDSLFIGEEDFPQLQEKQSGKPYYVPPREELLKYADEFYYEETAAYRALRDYLEKDKRMSRKKAAVLTEELWMTAYMGEAADNPRQLFDTAENMGCVLNGKDDMNRFFQLYTNMSNNTRIPSNRGYTPEELMKLSGSRPASITLKDSFKQAVKDGAIDLQELRESAADIGLPMPEMQLSFLHELDRIEGELQAESGENPVVKLQTPYSRNAPCPCGSGRKYKHCCGKDKPLIN